MDAQLRPRLESIATFEQLVAREKLEIRDHCFAFLDVWFVEIENVHHPEMDAADLSAVIIQKGNDPIVESCLDSNLFIYFAFNPGTISFFVPGKQRFVAIVHVPADADRSFGD